MTKRGEKKDDEEEEESVVWLATISSRDAVESNQKSIPSFITAHSTRYKAAIKRTFIFPGIQEALQRVDSWARGDNCGWRRRSRRVGGAVWHRGQEVTRLLWMSCVRLLERWRQAGGRVSSASIIPHLTAIVARLPLPTTPASPRANEPV